MRKALLVLVAALVVLLLTMLAVLPDDEPARAVRTTISLADALSGRDTAGFRRATEPRPFSFPADHGPHPGFRTEWWYFTGNLEGTNGRRFGYHLTFFRNELGVTEESAGISAWAAGAVFMAHFALTDVDGGTFHAYDRFAREALGLAGASLEPFRVWAEDWSVEPWRGDGGPSPGGAENGPVDTLPGAPDAAQSDVFPLRLRAEHAGVAIDLRLERGRPPVLQGEDGLSRKGAEPGNASYYYSLTRMPTRGEIRMGEQTFEVLGASWMDREWSTSVLPDDVAGWDWFALQLDDGSDLMFYRLRQRDGGTSPFSAGSLVSPFAAAGDSTAGIGAAAVSAAGADSSAPILRLGALDVEIEVLDTWASPIDRTRYPARWRVRVPGADLELELEPVLANQELDLAVRYWEGAVVVRGTRAGEPVGGRGYVELTGYSDTAGPAGR